MVIITKANPFDFDAIRTLEKKAHSEEVTTKYDAALITRFGYAYIATENERIIGAITAWQTRNGEVKINDWVVHPKYRKRGIGTKLYLKLILETKGKTILSLVDVTNIASMKAHEKMGFKVMATIQDAYHIRKRDEQILWKLENK